MARRVKPAVRNMQISLGLPDPRDSSSFPILKRVQAGIKRVRLMSNNPAKVRLPITAPLLKRIRKALDQSSYPQKVVIWAVACTAFFGFFMLGELLPETAGAYSPSLSLSWGDVTVDSQEKPRMVKLHLRKSKCDQFWLGADIILGRTLTPLCPVASVLSYIVVRRTDPGPFFLSTEGRTITKAWFVGKIRGIVAGLGLPQHQYAGHSFRIGAATSAALVGIEDLMIQTLGRWHSAF